MKTVKQIIEEIRADIEIRPTPLDEQLDELLKSYEKEIDELSNTLNDTCENLAWYINERQRLLKVIEYSKPHEGLQRTIQKALERPHGEWKLDGTCSECGVYSSLNKDTTYFCPNCGAKMGTLIHGCSFASEECKKNPCADCGVREGDEK